METAERKELQSQLRDCQREYRRAKARIRDLGFICKGSLTERRLPCGRPNCRCHKDPENRHGPYWQLSWKDAGKTISHYLPAEMIALYRQWIDNHRELIDILSEMLAISRRAADCLRTLATPNSKPAKANQPPTQKST